MSVVGIDRFKPKFGVDQTQEIWADICKTRAVTATVILGAMVAVLVVGVYLL